MTALSGTARTCEGARASAASGRGRACPRRPGRSPGRPRSARPRRRRRAPRSSPRRWRSGRRCGWRPSTLPVTPSIRSSRAASCRYVNASRAGVVSSLPAASTALTSNTQGPSGSARRAVRVLAREPRARGAPGLRAGTRSAAPGSEAGEGRTPAAVSGGQRLRAAGDRRGRSGGVDDERPLRGRLVGAERVHRARPRACTGHRPAGRACGLPSHGAQASVAEAALVADASSLEDSSLNSGARLVVAPAGPL